MRPSVQQPISKDKNVMAWARKYYLIFLFFDLEVKGQGPTKVIMVRDTPPYGHAPTYQISLTYLKRQKCYGPDKKILFKKQLFDLEVKSQGPTKVIMVCNTVLWSCTHIPNKYYLKNNYLTLRSKSHEGHYGTRHTALWSCTHIPNIIDLSRKTKMLWPRQENTI